MSVFPFSYSSLAALQRMYPFGIPLQISEKRDSVTKEVHQRKKIAFVGAIPGATQEAPFSGVGGELLLGALTKGLQYSVEDGEVYDPSWAPLETLHEVEAACIVVLGEGVVKGAPSFGEQITSGDSKIVTSHELSDILASPLAKRAFWEHLKAMRMR